MWIHPRLADVGSKVLTILANIVCPYISILSWSLRTLVTVRAGRRITILFYTVKNNSHKRIVLKVESLYDSFLIIITQNYSYSAYACNAVDAHIMQVSVSSKTFPPLPQDTTCREQKPLPPGTIIVYENPPLGTKQGVKSPTLGT